MIFAVMEMLLWKTVISIAGRSFCLNVKIRWSEVSPAWKAIEANSPTFGAPYFESLRGLAISSKRSSRPNFVSQPLS